ncbi:protein of unknown function (plasmid) [Azospirillum baldaniorum]|uniref:Uncharacterized protein n=1 Tax=Azospirillum baldaniorum TaxID=1064539 RepID=A0A9P1JVR2_9PROT|nr:protein of unknown function [Azospirillum baldaniorum]
MRSRHRTYAMGQTVYPFNKFDKPVARVAINSTV